MQNIQIYNRCKTELLLGIQLEQTRSEYHLGYSMLATTDIGKERKKQEDEVLILEHPSDNEVKLLAVADGVGSEQNSGRASKFLLEELAYCFEITKKLPNYDALDLEYIFKSKLQKINKEMVDRQIGTTTLSMAISKPTETLILNSGDSRVYTYKNKKLTQQTKDDSLVQKYYDHGIIKNKKLLRFHNDSNIITSAVGSTNYHVSSKIISTDYEILLALTDGVTDNFSDKEMTYLIKKYKKYNLANILVDFAKENMSYNPLPYNKDYSKQLVGGSDNLSVAVLKRR